MRRVQNRPNPLLAGSRCSRPLLFCFSSRSSFCISLACLHVIIDSRMSHLSRKILLTAHVVSSVGWLGAVVAFLVVAAVLQTRDFNTMRSAHWAMNLIAWSSEQSASY